MTTQLDDRTVTSSPPIRHSPRRRQFRRDRREWGLFLLLVLPNLVLIGTFNYWPVIQNFYLSLTSWDFLAPMPQFVGIANYRRLLASPDFHTVLINSLLYAAAIIACVMVLGLAMAMLFNQKIRGASFGRLVSFAPHIITGSALATLWIFILNPRYGLQAGIFGPLGIPTLDWTNDASLSLWSLVIYQVWSRVGFTALIFLAALQSLPRDVYEAAMLDGAGRWRQFRQITLPLLSPVTLFLLIITTLHSVRSYEATALMTGGGPGISSTTITWYIYELAFSNYDVGQATAAGVILFIILIGVSAAQFAVGGKRVHYQ